jgi:hypothetical protein
MRDSFGTIPPYPTFTSQFVAHRPIHLDYPAEMDRFRIFENMIIVMNSAIHVFDLQNKEKRVIEIPPGTDIMKFCAEVVIFLSFDTTRLQACFYDGNMLYIPVPPGEISQPMFANDTFFICLENSQFLKWNKNSVTWERLIDSFHLFKCRSIDKVSFRFYLIMNGCDQIKNFVYSKGVIHPLQTTPFGSSCLGLRYKNVSIRGRRDGLFTIYYKFHILLQFQAKPCRDFGSEYSPYEYDIHQNEIYVWMDDHIVVYRLK